MKQLLIAVMLIITSYSSYSDYVWSVTEGWETPVQFGADDLSVLQSYIKLSPDGTELIHFKPWDSTIVYYNPIDGKKIRTIKTPEKIYNATFSKDGKIVFYRNQNARFVIASYPELIKEKTIWSASCLKFQYYENENRVALLGGELNLVDIEKDVILEKIKIPGNESALYSAPTNKVAYITTSNIDTQSEQCYVNVVDEEGKLIFQYAIYCGAQPLQYREREIAVSNDGNLLVFHGKDRLVNVYDFRTGELRKGGVLDDQVDIFEFTYNDKEIYAGLGHKGLRRVNLETLKVEELMGGGANGDLCFNADTTIKFSLSEYSIHQYKIKRPTNNVDATNSDQKLVKSFSNIENVVRVELNENVRIKYGKLINMQGKVIQAINGNETNIIEISTGLLPKGTYIIALTDEKDIAESIKINIL